MPDNNIVNELAKLSTTNTKSEMLDTIKKAVELLKVKEAATFNPAKEAEVKQKGAVVAKVEVGTDVVEKINDINGSLKTLFNDLLSKIEEGTKEYSNLKTAIGVQNEKLKELFGIETEMMKLVAIINAQAEAKETFAVEMAEKKAEAEAKIDEMLKAMQEQKAKFEKELAEEKAVTAEARKKDAETYKYDFDRKKKIDADNWEDEKATLKKNLEVELEGERKVIAVIKNELDEREEDLVKREDKLEDLEAKVANIPSLIEDAKTKAAEEATEKARSSYNFQKQIAETQYKGEKQLLETKIATLEDNAKKDAATIADLQNKLNEAYKEIKDMANKTVESASGSRYMSTLEKIASENKNNSNK